VAYTWDYMHDGIRAKVMALPREAGLAFLELMAAAELNPWGVNLRPGETRDRNMPNVPFGPGARGMVAYLIDEAGQMLLVTDVVWSG
jgi:hypothetical protein